MATNNGIEIELYEIYTKDRQQCLVSVWCESLEDAQRIAYLLDGEAEYQCVGIVRPE